MSRQRPDFVDADIRIDLAPFLKGEKDRDALGMLETANGFRDSALRQFPADADFKGALGNGVRRAILLRRLRFYLPILVLLGLILNNCAKMIPD